MISSDFPCARLQPPQQSYYGKTLAAAAAASKAGLCGE